MDHELGVNECELLLKQNTAVRSRVEGYKLNYHKCVGVRGRKD